MGWVPIGCNSAGPSGKLTNGAGGSRGLDNLGCPDGPMGWRGPGRPPRTLLVLVEGERAAAASGVGRIEMAVQQYDGPVR
jgi:hypothetical protein